MSTGSRIGVLASVAVLAVAQSVDDIVARAVAALGGAERFAAVRSVRTQGRLRIGDGPWNPITVRMKRPSLFRMDLTLGDQRISQVYDGRAGWQSVNGQPFAPVSGKELRKLADQAVNAIGGPLVEARERGNRISLAGRAPVDGKEYFKLEITLGTGNVMYEYLDPVTWLEAREDFGDPASPSIVETVSDFRRIGGVLVPCLFVTRGSGGAGASQTLQMDSVEINPALDDAKFQVGPASAKPGEPRQ